MVYDTAWDMPKANWVQQGSFTIPEIPPAYEPDEEPLVCLPPINQYWLPYVMGALDQLRNPSSWLVADDAAMSTALARVARLREMIGVRAVCMSYVIRFDGGTCQLQQSVDGGATWTEVDGWSSFAACQPPQTLLQFTSGCALQESFDGGATYTTVPGWADFWIGCVQDAVPIIGLPPNPGDQTPDQFACSIATYLAEQIIIGAMGLAVTTVQDNLTLISLAVSIGSLIPEFVLVRLGVDAIASLYGYIAEGTLTDYEDALTSAPLLADVICAIYGCIVGDGYVTPDNVACILSAIGSISYAHSDVVTAIVGYLTSLGPTGLAQLSQVAGLESGADCSGCDTWCYTFDFLTSMAGFGNRGGVAPTIWALGVGWTSALYAGYQAFDIYNSLGPYDMTSVEIEGTIGGDGSTYGSGFASTFGTGHNIDLSTLPPGATDYTAVFGATMGGAELYINTTPNTSPTTITRITLRGTGTPPTGGGVAC